MEGGEAQEQSMEEELHLDVVREEGEALGEGGGIGLWAGQEIKNEG